MSKDLPSFASRWIQQWKQAAPRLQAIRDEELRLQGQGSKGSVGAHYLYERNPQRHGMVIMQQWFIRRQLLELMRSKQDD